MDNKDTPPKQLLSALKHHTPIYREGLPLFTEQPLRSSPFFLWKVENYLWETKVEVFTIHYLIEGKLKVELEGGKEVIIEKSGGCLLLTPKQEIRVTPHECSTVSVFCAHFSSIPHELSHEKLNYCKIQEQVLFTSLAHYAVSSRGQKSESDQYCDRALVVLYDIALKNMTQSSPLFNDAIQALCEEIKRQPGLDWTVGKMCADLKLSKAHLSRKFKEAVGISPNRYVIQQRITTASQLLQFTNYTIKQIAEKMGYSSVSFFSRQFHQITGHTPGEVKELAHGGRALK